MHSLLFDRSAVVTHCVIVAMFVKGCGSILQNLSVCDTPSEISLEKEVSYFILTAGYGFFLALDFFPGLFNRFHRAVNLCSFCSIEHQSVPNDASSLHILESLEITC